MPSKKKPKAKTKAKKKAASKKKAQDERFKETARKLQVDESDVEFEKALKKMLSKK